MTVIGSWTHERPVPPAGLGDGEAYDARRAKEDPSVKECPECGVQFATGELDMADYKEKMHLQYDEVVAKFRNEASASLGRSLSDREFQEWWRKQPTFLSFDVGDNPSSVAIERARARSTPSTRTLMLPSGSLTLCTILASVPTA